MTLLLVLALQALTALQVWCQDSEPGTASLGSSSLYSTRFQDVTWNNQEWSLTTTTIRPSDFRSVSFISNGYIGLSMASNGPFVQTFPESAGWPLFDQRQTFGTVSGFFDRQGSFNGTNFPWLSQYGWDSGISGIPAWGPLIVDLGNGVYLDANTSLSDISEVTLTQDFKQGIAEWQYTWTPASTDLAFNVSYTAFADKLHINRAYVRLRLTASKDCNVTIVNVLDGLNALRSIPIDKGSDGNFIYSAVNPVGVDNVTAWVFACAVASTATNFTESTAPKPYIKDASYSIAQEATIQVKAKVGITVTKFIGIASTDAFSNPRQHAKISAEAAMSDGYDKSFEAHKTEWAQVLPADGISNYSDPFTGQLPEIPAIIEKQIVSVVSVFALLMNTISQNAVMAVNNASVNINGISVGGLTSDAYAGQRFWDEDVSVRPMKLP
ncbi:MAG: hypothetical protein LQ340_002055 [Diploschistes diacapsis]|nr:MAG: hypothetical protein LQ340_002055 [Diploschistes diacapsis]